ncbi:hypothetical protein PF008_g10659 [Phytophthora fragariae]|uniref:WW domain-containing protein n=1 Tax=Phytophthora fragariae TaxID=53985 RepID=A0A6G0RTL7_9STRA|nr:hypothetical protein PF008_g10659 [Phytophthora fragariae]
MSHYGPSSNGAAYPRGGPPPFRGPPPAATFPRGGPPPFRPPFAARGPPPFAFRGPPPAFRGPPPGLRPPMGLSIPPPMAFQAPPSPANAGPMLPPGWSEHRTPQGATYFYNAATGVSTYDMPTPVQASTPKWVEYKDDATGAFYYFNTVTKETVWDQPEEFRMQKAREQVAKMTSQALHAASAASPVAAQVQTHFQSHSQVQGQAPEHDSSASTEKEDEDDEEEIKRQEAQEQTRRKRKEEQEQEQAAQFTDMPRAERMAAFKQFLEDKQITPTLKWGDAQRTIGKDSSMHNDPRWKFALTTVGEKKQAYAEYCTQAKNRATIEKRRLVKKAREEFIELLGLFESTLAPSRRRPISWDEVTESNNFYALRKDPRWSAIEETRERQQLFATFIQDLERNQKARLAKRREALQTAFMDLLRQRVESKELELSGSRSSKRLDSDTKRCVLDLLEEVELPNGGGKVGEEALRIVEKHDVYDWAEGFLREQRELERAKRKRERAERAERDEKLGRELNEQLKELEASQKLTVGSTWNEFSAEHLKYASEQQAKTSKSEVEGDAVGDEEDEDHEEGDGDYLHWKTQRRIFDKFVRRLRRDLEPAAAAIRGHLDRSGDPPLRVTEATTYAVFVDALESGVSVALDSNAPEEGEEEVVEEMDGVTTSGEPGKTDSEMATGETEGVEKPLTAQEVDAALEAVVKTHREKTGDATPVEFPAFVRQVFDMWVAMAKEDIRREEEKHRKRSRKGSRDLAPEDEDDDDRPRRSRRRSPAADELEDDKTHKKHRHRGSRKRRRSHGSPSVSRSRSRSRSESRPAEVGWRASSTSSSTIGSNMLRF